MTRDVHADSTRVLFVCAGNICRSPMAEAFFRAVRERRPDLHHVRVGSAGTIAIDGNSPLPQTVRVMRDDHGLDVAGHHARRIHDGFQAEIILTLDRHVTSEVRRLQLDGDVQLIGDFAGSPGEEVEDPYGGGAEDYRECALQIRRLVEAVADRLALRAAAP